jgi:hypothetical protein
MVSENTISENKLFGSFFRNFCGFYVSDDMPYRI